MRQVTPEEVAAALARVYARPELGVQRLHPVLQWVADRWTALRSWIGDRLLSVAQLEDTAPIVFWIVVGLLVLLFLGALTHIVLALRSAMRGRGRQAPAPVGHTADTDERNPVEWERRARAAASAGRLREAALALYHAVVLRLDLQGAVRFRPGKTAGEYRREARGSAAVGPRFDRFLRTFHPMAFGPHGPDVRAWESLRVTAAELGSHA